MSMVLATGNTVTNPRKTGNLPDLTDCGLSVFYSRFIQIQLNLIKLIVLLILAMKWTPVSKKWNP